MKPGDMLRIAENIDDDYIDGDSSEHIAATDIRADMYRVAAEICERLDKLLERLDQ